MKTMDHVATSATSRRLSFAVERWRLRDAAAIVRASRINEISLSAPSGTPVRYGVAPVAAGFAYGDRWGHGNDDDSDAYAQDYRRQQRVSISYHANLARIGDAVLLRTESTDDTLLSQVTGPDDIAIATIEQSLRAERLVDEALADDAGLTADADQEFTRVRVARWVYVAGENRTACGNHVAATSAGLPAAPVPGSLLMALAERQLFLDRAPSGELVGEFGVPVFAGDRATVELRDGAMVLRTGRGVALEATVR